MRLLFDRGTVLAADPEIGLDLGQVPGFLWDARVRAYRAPASRYTEIRAGFLKAGVRFSDEVRISGSSSLEAWPTIDLRPYQEAALLAWELAERRGLVVLPTGSGKTRVAVGAMARTSLRTLCLVPTRVLLEQWLGELRTVCPHPVGCYGDGVHELAPVSVATFESAYRWMHILGNRFDMLVVDEAHHFGAGIRDEALEMSIANARLGLTATPPKEGPAAKRLTELIGPAVYELAIGDLAGRFLASFDAITLNLQLSGPERSTYDALMTTFRSVHQRFRQLAPQASWQDFAVSAVRTPEGRRAFSSFHQARKLLAYTEAKKKTLGSLLRRHKEARMLIFTADNETAYAIARDQLIMPLTCDIGRKERDGVLARFRSGELRALVSSRVLNEGLDVPDADVGVILGGALGEREHVQRVGRMLRPKEGKRALVYELVAARTMEVAQARRRRQGLAPRITAQI